MNKTPFVIGITGGSGSGKTFFLKCFLNHFKENEISLISQDDYYHPVGEMDAEANKHYNFDLPETIDDRQFLSDIKTLIAGEPVYKKEYTFNKPGAVPKMLRIDPAPIIIVEGLFILHLEHINSLLDMRIFIESDERVALQRRIKRDLVERGYSEEDVKFKWINHVMPAYNEYLFPHKDKSDKVVTNNTNIAEDIIAITEELSAELKALNRHQI